jgi:SAM-dependent methyltransferase
MSGSKERNFLKPNYLFFSDTNSDKTFLLFSSYNFASMKDVLGQALWDYYHNLQPGKLWIHNKYGKKEEMPLETYFRNKEHMPHLELAALKQCKGKVLDIGAGAGSHALLLQERLDVTALEISAMAVELMKLRGVEKVINENIFEFTEHKFDTLLLLMNGIGLTGTILNLRTFLQHAKNLLNRNGQLIFDSSDVAYLFDGKPHVAEPYYGEISYQYEYKKQKTEWFKWLYIDNTTLTKIANGEGWNIEELYVDEYDQYLVKLTLQK